MRENKPFFFRYLREIRLPLCAFFFFFLIFLVSFLLYRLPIGAVIYPFLLSLLAGAVFLFCDYTRRKREYETRKRLLSVPAELLSEIPFPDTPTDNDYRVLLMRLQTDFSALRESEAAAFRDAVDYYTLWVHQIKTPIASMRLTLQNEDTPVSRRLSSDLFRIEQYADMVLTYIRLGEGSNDYVFRPVPLDDLLRSVLRRYAQEFIVRRLRLDYTPPDFSVITDEKWLAFVAGQLLSNALKYTPAGTVSIRAEGKTLLISDTGIGIAEEDLPRIFERGYTGENGRTDRSASGIGLFLCKKICDNLGIGLSITSKVGKGTTAALDLSQYHLRAE